MALPLWEQWALKLHSWTRCRIPIHKPIPNDLERADNGYIGKSGWMEPLWLLVESPGFYCSFCGRNIDDPEDVLFTTLWNDEASLNSFKASPGYPAYFQAFFGVSSPPSPSAFFTTPPGTYFIFQGKVTIFTFSYKHPVAADDRHLKSTRGYENTSLKKSGLGFRNRETWVREPQLLDGQMVQHAMLFQTWPIHYDFDIQGLMSKDPYARGVWEDIVKWMNPLALEEATYLMEIAEPEDQEEEEGQEENEDDSEGERETEVDAEGEDEDEDEDQELASKQLLEGLMNS